MQNLPETKLYTIGEAAGFLGISINTLKRWEAKGKILAGRTPTGIRIFKGQDINSLKASFEPNHLAYTVSKVKTSLPSSYKIAFFVLCFLLILLSGITLFTVFHYSPLPQTVSDKITRVQLDLKNKASDFLVSLLKDRLKGVNLVEGNLLLSEVPGNLLINSDNNSQDSEDSTLSFSRGTLTPNAILRWDSTNDLFQFESFPLLLSSNLTVRGGTSIGGTLTVSSQSTLDSLLVTNDMSVGGNTTLSGDLALNGDDLTSDGNLTIAATGYIRIGDSGTPGVAKDDDELYVLGDIEGDGNLDIAGSITLGGGITSSGDHTISGDLAVNGGDITSTSSTFNLLNQPTTLNIGSTNVTRTVNIGTGTNADTINIGTGGVTADTINIGGISGTTITITGNVNITGPITGTSTIQGTQLISTVSTGTAPLVVASTTEVTNLNANYVSGNTASTLMSQPQPNLVLNSDFSRRNKWMTFMPEVFSDTSGWTAVTGTLGSVTANKLTAGSTGLWQIRAGLSTWRDGRWSAQGRLTADEDGGYIGAGKFVDANNYVIANVAGGTTDLFRLTKRVAGVYTQVTTVAYAPTLNNFYWVELEAQGTTYIAKLYSSGAGSVAKANATLVATVSGTISDAAVAAGYAHLESNLTVASQWGDVSSGDGGVYVEGWGPESFTPYFTGTVKGGESLGFDETVDSGPLGKQWALRVYIPAGTRRIVFNNAAGDNALPDGSVAPSTPYTYSGYVKTSGKTGTGILAQLEMQPYSSAFVAQGAALKITDSGETDWTRLTASGTVGSGTRRGQVFMTFGSATAYGTAFAQLTQFEQGSNVTPWRNAPADDGPIVWEVGGELRDITTTDTSATGVEINPGRLSINTFLPWDANVYAQLRGQYEHNTANTTSQVLFNIDGSLPASNYVEFIDTEHAAGYAHPLDARSRVVALSSGKRRVTPHWHTTAGTLRSNGSGITPLYMMVVATRGKFDLAEEYGVSDFSIESGDVVKLSGVGGTTVEKVIGGYQQDILGIISTAPGITLSSTVELNSYIDKPNLRPVALQGRVPVKVTSENGPIKRGDILTSSNTKPGYAMLATRAGRSIGIAMEDLPEGVTEGKIMTFVNLSFYDPQVYITDSGTLSVIKVSSEPVLLADSNGELRIENEELEEQTPIYQIQNNLTKEIIERIGAFNNLFVANLKVGSIDVDTITSKEIDELRIKNQELGISSASLSARLTFLESIASASSVLSDSVSSTDSASFSDLTIFNKLLTTDLGITGTISSGLLVIEGINPSTSSGSSINTLSGDLYLQSNLLGGVNILSGKVLIDKDGNVKVEKGISASEYIVSGNESIGEAVIPAGQLELQIASPLAFPTSKIFITGTTQTGGQPLLVTNKSVGSFTVSIENPYHQDISFDWWIVGRE